MKKLMCIILSLILLLSLCSCGKETGSEADAVIRIGALTGPTSMGMVKLMENDNYEFSLSADPGAFASALAKDELDIAAVPANLAAVIYNNTNGAIKVLAVNTLGVLYIVERGDSIRSAADLRGKTLYATGAGAVPEYSLRYILRENGLDADTDIDIHWCSDTTEALSYIVSDGNAVAMLPQPFVTAAQTQVGDLRIALDLNSEWGKTDNGSEMVTGVLAVRSEFAEEHPELLERFTEEYADSVDFVLSDPDAAAELIGQHEIVKAPIALRALPYCNICLLTDADMKSALEGYLRVLYELNSTTVGGALPGEDFYYGA